MRLGFLVLTTILGVFFIFLFQKNKLSKNSVVKNSNTITYIPIGDSYTIGLGVAEQERWPNMLVENINKQNIPLHLILNPAVSGFTVDDAITYELPEVDKFKPDIVTVLIGANDNFRQVPVTQFTHSYRILLNRLQKIIPNPRHIVLITLPDHTRSPAGQSFDDTAGSKLIEEYNNVIKNEGQKREMPVVDIFPISQTMTTPADFIADGLHPSRDGYIKWERVIYQTMFAILSE